MENKSTSNSTLPLNKFMVRLSVFIDKLADFGVLIAMICLAALVVIVAAEVAGRYILQSSSGWIQEVSVYLYMAVGFLGAAYALKNDSHFSITFFSDRLTKKNQAILRFTTSIVGGLYCAIFTFEGINLVMFSLAIGERSTGVLQIPLWVPQTLFPVGSLLLCLQFLNRSIKELTLLKTFF